ncbi:MAG: hypothetical protein ABI690_26970 [Chloroflexota bacterium]
MVNWAGMFAGVQAVVRSAEGTADGIQRTCAFAAQHPDEYDEPDYWARVASSTFPFDTLIGWIHEGLLALEPLDGEVRSLLLLDCGDCPDGLWLGECRTPSVSDYAGFERYVKANVVVEGEDFAQAHIKDVKVLTHHLVTELNDPILSYPLFDKQWHGTNGYLLWLAAASLALSQPLRDANFCRQILHNRERLLIMSGFEEIFFDLGTVTPDGLSLE